jgi:4-amino-4-deoxy-L-arabinose transferase-like glycosyltransferase
MRTNSNKRLEILLISILIAIIAVLLVLGSVPPVSRDALTHHLFVPKLYIERGFMELPWLSFSYYPMNLDLLYLIPLYFGNDIVPKYIHGGFALLTAGLIFLYLKKWLGNIFGYLGALFFLTIPIIIKLATTVYVDLGLVFFSTAALFFMLKWAESGLQFRYVSLAAVFCGLALGTKYNGLVVLCVLGLILPVMGLRGHPVRTDSPTQPEQRRRTTTLLLHWIMFGAIALLVFSPWMLRNYLWVGNPLHPLYKSAFHSLRHAAVDDDGNQNADLAAHIRKAGKKVNHFIIRRQIYKESGGDILLIPLRIFFQGQDDNPKYFDGRLSPLLLLLPLFAFWGARSEGRKLVLEKLAWLMFAILYLTIAFLSVDMRIRYIAPIIPPLTILSIFGLRNIWCFQTSYLKASSCKSIKYILIAIVGVVWVSQGGYIWNQFQKYHPVLYLSGKISRPDYIASHRPEYPVMQFANKSLKTDARLLGIYLGGRGYYSDREIRFGDRLFETIIQQSQSAREINHRLQERGFTHILIDKHLFNQWSAPRLDIHQKQRLQMFFKRETRLLFGQGEHALYELTAPQNVS